MCAVWGAQVIVSKEERAFCDAARLARELLRRSKAAVPFSQEMRDWWDLWDRQTHVVDEALRAWRKARGE